MNQKLKEKITESLSSVLPVTCIVLILGITIAPIPLDPLMLFLAGAAFLIIGMGFFTLGEMCIRDRDRRSCLHGHMFPGKFRKDRVCP